MTELTDLYQELILEHNKKPRNFHRLEPHTHQAEGFNPLCGDRLVVELSVEDDTVKDIGFVGAGCAICMASASMMTEAVKGQAVAVAMQLFDTMHGYLAGQGTVLPPGKLAALAGVRDYPMRVKCATLPWHTLQNALQGQGGTAQTE